MSAAEVVSAPVPIRLKWLAAAAFVMGLASPIAHADPNYLFLDVPATLGGTDYQDVDVLLNNNGTYSVVVPGGLPVLALERMPNGLWLAVLESATDLSPGVFAGHNDVIVTDTISPPQIYFSGSAAGVPDYAGIDALFMEANGDLVFSFDVPVNLAGTEYKASDLVRYSGGLFSLYWSAQAAGVPADANLVGADRDAAGRLVLTFDIPVRLGGVDYLPGSLVAWTNPGFVSYFTDPAWPAYAKLRDLSFVPAAGQVPGDPSEPGIPLTVTRNTATGELTLSWGTSCLPNDTDYEIYEGTMGPFTTQGFYSHTQKFCTTGGLTSLTFPEPDGSVYYLVVPRNAAGEGSYGQASNLSERPVGVNACLPQSLAGQCP